MRARRQLAVGPAVALTLVAAAACTDASQTDETTRDEEGTVEEGGDLGAFRLQVGDCFDDPVLTGEVAGGAEVESVSAVPCGQEHDFQVFATFDVPDADAYPGDEAVASAADDGCLELFEPFVGVPYAESGYGYSYLYPTADTWASLGDREVVCLLASPDGQKLTGDGEGSAR